MEGPNRLALVAAVSKAKLFLPGDNTYDWSKPKYICYLSVVVLSVDDFESYPQTGEDATDSFGTWKALEGVAI
jgi:hypothetical protein